MARMNRTRYTVTLRSGETLRREVILAYSADGARSFYEGRGNTVVEIEKGDYRLQSPDSGFNIMQDALKAAQKELGLVLPVKIRFNARQGRTNGNYRFNTTHHDIMIKSYLSPEQASSTLWHELTHAMQAERVGGTKSVWADFLKDQSSYSYKNRPIEIEANKMSRAKKDSPLCVAKG